MLKVVVTGNKHIVTPNTPRNSQHHLIQTTDFPRGKYPIRKLWKPLGNFLPWQPIWEDYQVIHSFKKIIYTNKPWLITFEDHLPLSLYTRSKNQLESQIYQFLNNRLALENCKKIITLSEYAKLRISNRVQDWDNAKKIKEKLTVIHPNFPIQVNHGKKYNPNQPLQVIFIGRHLARKGGIVALRLAQKAQHLNLPIKFNIISNLQIGGGIPTDFYDKNKYAEDLKLLDLDNVNFYKSLPNQQVIDLLSQSHFQLLATLQDTYGYSVVEGFTVATPAITSNVCALPEIITSGKNGYLLELPLSENRQWNNWLYREKSKTEEYWQILNDTYNALADAALEKIISFLDRGDKSEHYESLSYGALSHAQNFNNAEKQNQVFDELYTSIAGLY